MNKAPDKVYVSDRTMDAATFEESAALTKAQQGDKVAFGSLVKVYERRAYAVAYGFVGNRDDALELAQESFAKAFKAMPRFRAGLPFYPWLHKIIRNTCLNHLKKRKRRGEISLDGLMESGFDVTRSYDTPAKNAALNDAKTVISSAMRRLSAEHREIITMRHFQEMSYKEIADCLNIPKGTVMSRLHSARLALREKIGESPI